MVKHIAIIGSGEMAAIIAKEAKKMGVISHSFSNNPTDKVIGHSNYHHNVDIFDYKKVIKICKNLKISGVLPTTEITINIAAKVANALNLVGLSVEISDKVTDKGYIRDKLSNLSYIKQPFYKVWKISSELPKIDKYPVIVKPTEMGGKRGVSIVNSEEELNEALIYSISSMPDSKNKLIFEGYIESGNEYSIESISFKGSHQVIQITEKITSGPPHFAELGHIQPANLPIKLKEEIENIIPKILNETKIDNTTTHIEVKINEEGIFLIELNARSGGDHISSTLTKLSTGYSYIQAAIEVALGEYIMPDTKKFNDNVSGVIFITKQTAQFQSLFEECHQYSWLHKKNTVTDGLKEILINQAFDTNYMIFKAEKDIPKEIKKLL